MRNYFLTSHIGTGILRGLKNSTFNMFFRQFCNILIRFRFPPNLAKIGTEPGGGQNKGGRWRVLWLWGQRKSKNWQNRVEAQCESVDHIDLIDLLTTGSTKDLTEPRFLGSIKSSLCLFRTESLRLVRRRGSGSTREISSSRTWRGVLQVRGLGEHLNIIPD